MQHRECAGWIAQMEQQGVSKHGVEGGSGEGEIVDAGDLETGIAQPTSLGFRPCHRDLTLIEIDADDLSRHDALGQIEGDRADAAAAVEQ